ncbi:MAG: isopentenyl phosphate kinase family protein [Chloroflexi bacterium]|nr:isopentenyl phosphate kinase family protein [Chloroflexota bacterium]
MENLIFLKLGGSLITDKERPQTPRLDRLKNLSTQIADVRARDPNLLLLIGHGSGSFGHVAAKKYATRDGLPSQPSPSPFEEKEEGNYWHGFTEVWHEAAALNKIVMDTLREANIPAMAFSPSGSVIAQDGKVKTWDLRPLERALKNGVLPIVHGDVIFDEVRGGTILSTEDLFMHLAREMHPQRILLAGLEDGIYADFPARKHKVESVTPESYENIKSSVGASASTDVTGGMDSKVQQMLGLVESFPDLKVQIFSGKGNGNLKKVLEGDNIGTIIKVK